MATILGGIIGGLIAAIVMAAMMMGMGDDSPPPAQLHAEYVGDGNPDNSMMAGMLMHFGYGIGAGAVYGWLGSAGLFAVSLSGALLTGVVNGAIFGIVLWIIALAFWGMMVLDMESDPAQAGMMLVMHLVYGVILGGFVALEIL